jgi:hypothetical protein
VRKKRIFKEGDFKGSLSKKGITNGGRGAAPPEN